MFNIINLFKKQKVVTRIAPSPTGVMHIGTARTALFNYLFAKKHGGKFILRIEDTDKERSTKEFEKDILDGMEWLGFNHDEFYRQSDRTAIYTKYIEKLIKENKAYISKETEGTRETVIRFRNPNKVITFSDQIRGDITFDTTELGDFVIAKSKEEPLYHLAVVIDDFEMGITHIIRGEDGISNTPRQILIQQAIGAKTPTYAHLPLILGKDKSKLSKRHGAVSLTEFKEEGYLNSALVNFLAFLGWNPGDDREIFSLSELIKEFDLKKVSKSGAIFNEEKLDWYNHQYIRKELDSDDKFIEYFSKSKNKIDPNLLIKIKNVILERISNLKEFDSAIEAGELDFILKDLDYTKEKLIWKNENSENTLVYLEKILEKVSETNNQDFTADKIKNNIWSFAEEKGRGNVLWPFRYALSRQDKSPDPFVLCEILGKDETISRLNHAIKKLQS